MEEIAHTFGVEWPKLLAQVIIFMVVYLILKKKAFGPIMGMLEKRRARIEEGEANLAKIRKDLEAAETKVQEIIGKANDDANRLVNEAKTSAEAATEKKRQEAVAEAQQIVSKARDAAVRERDTLLGDMKRDFGRLVVEATSKVTGKVLTSEDQERINKETAAQVTL